MTLKTKKVEEKLYNADYALLNDSEFKELLHRHEEAGKRAVGVDFRTICGQRFNLHERADHDYLVYYHHSSSEGRICQNGDTFFERPLFIITIVASIAIMAMVILIVASNINKSYLEANEKYAELDRIFYFIDI